MMRLLGPVLFSGAFAVKFPGRLSENCPNRTFWGVGFGLGALRVGVIDPLRPAVRKGVKNTHLYVSICCDNAVTNDRTCT